MAAAEASPPPDRAPPASGPETGDFTSPARTFSTFMACLLEAVAHEPDGLARPLWIEVIERVLENRRVAVVVLGPDDDVGVGGGDLRGPARDGGIAVDAALAYWRLGAVEERQREVAQVEQLGHDSRLPARLAEDPVGGLSPTRPSRVE